MANNILHLNAVVFCMHQGQAMPIMAVPQVLVSGFPIVTRMDNYVINNCQNPIELGGPCISAQWLTAATRVFSNKMPVLLNSSQALCTPTQTGLLITMTQQRVTGQ